MKSSINSLVALALTAFITTASVEAAESVSVSDLHANRIALGGKQVTITGTVIKVNNGIMRRNFIHLQDGTGSGDTDRVIFTSQQKVSVGDTVSGTGTVALDTDFTMGYFYPTLVEKATFEPTK
ncbi:MAG: hypothetical protein JKY27_03185 [Magnetovibrio sp.]|nr:hypothetical protein [Magnetovibrio sp.]